MIAIKAVISLVTALAVHVPHGQAWALPAGVWQPVGAVKVEVYPSGSFLASFESTYWGGLYTPSPAGCDYVFSAQARVLEGGGYSLGARASIDSGGTPHAQTMQYDIGAGGYKDVLLPQHSEDGPLRSATLDDKWHTMQIFVVGDEYRSAVDGNVIFRGATRTTCGEGLFIRLWNSALVEFRNATVTSGPALPSPLRGDGATRR